jgi:hypothetical protein
MEFHAPQLLQRSSFPEQHVDPSEQRKTVHEVTGVTGDPVGQMPASTFDQRNVVSIPVEHLASNMVRRAGSARRRRIARTIYEIAQ